MPQIARIRCSPAAYGFVAQVAGQTGLSMWESLDLVVGCAVDDAPPLQAMLAEWDETQPAEDNVSYIQWPIVLKDMDLYWPTHGVIRRLFHTSKPQVENRSRPLRFAYVNQTWQVRDYRQGIWTTVN
jgi:hypothetical protein